MKYFFVVFLALAATVIAQNEINQYTTKFDSIDVDEILKSDRLFNNYYKCLLDLGRCTPEGVELKRVLPEALETSCAKCSEKQRETSDRAIKYLTENRPEEWKVLKARYDPDNKYSKKNENDA